MATDRSNRSSPQSQNGSGFNSVQLQWMDPQGNVIWQQDANGRFTYNKYDLSDNKLIETIQDIDCNHLTQYRFDGRQHVAEHLQFARESHRCAYPVVARSPPRDGPESRHRPNLVTDYCYNSEGQLIQTLGPEFTNDAGVAVRTASWTVYDDHQQISAQGYATLDATLRIGTDYTLVGPLSITKRNGNNQVTDQLQVGLTSFTGAIEAEEISAAAADFVADIDGNYNLTTIAGEPSNPIVSWTAYTTRRRCFTRRPSIIRFPRRHDLLSHSQRRLPRLGRGEL